MRPLTVPVSSLCMSLVLLIAEFTGTARRSHGGNGAAIDDVFGAGDGGGAIGGEEGDEFATSSGFDGRPSGIPPIEFMMIRLPPS